MNVLLMRIIHNCLLVLTMVYAEIKLMDMFAIVLMVLLALIVKNKVC